jgi:hypothetical protein
MSLPYELARRGELYMIAQGTGGGMGDPLDRDPAGVMRDMDEALISHDVAWRIYRVVYDRQTLRVDAAATGDAREQARRERIAQSVPFDRFCSQWVKDRPSPAAPYFGCWSDRTRVHAGNAEVTHPAGQVFPPVRMPNPLQVRIDLLERELTQARQALARHGRG